MGSYKRRKGSPCCANDPLCNALGNANQRQSLRYIYRSLSPKIPKIVDEKISNGIEKCIFEILWCVTYLYAE